MNPQSPVKSEVPQYVRENDLHSFHEGLCDGKRPCIAVYLASEFDALTEQNKKLVAESDALKADAERYRFLRGNVRARFADTLPLEPQLIYTKRSDPFIKGYAERVDAAVDAARAALSSEGRKP